MTKSFTLNNTSDSILSRICLVSLIWLLLIPGGFSMSAYGRTSSVNTAALWSSSTYSDGDSVVWSASNVTFKLHNGGDIELYLSDHILIQKNRTYTLEWRVAEGYIINVTQVSVKARGTLQSYITVGTNKSGNIYGQSYTNVNSQVLSLGNSGTVDIYPESDRDDAIIHMEEITVTYTMDGVEKEVTFDGTKDWGNNGTEKYKPDSFKIDSPHVTFSLRKEMKQYNSGSGKKTHEYFYLTNDEEWAPLRWWVEPGYSIAVSGINFYSLNQRSWGTTGKGYVCTSRNKERKVRESNSWGEDEFKVSDGGADNLFGNPAIPLTNNEYFKYLKATSKEWNIKTITLTYTINPNSYDITLNNESPTTSGSTSVTVTYDANSQLSITNPTKDGYTFDGWYSGETAGNGSGTKVIDVDGKLLANITVDATVYTGADGIWKKTTATTLYAKWILNGIKNIMLDNQGATTAGTDSLSVRFMTDHYSKASISAPAKTGYTFDGYYSASSDGVQVIDADGNVVASAAGYTDSDKKWINGDDETTLYAHWTGVSYSVRFNGNGSTDGSMSNQAFVYGTAQSLTTIGFEKTCTVTYNANGGSCGIASSETPFSFLGWATSAGGDVEYADEEEVENLTSTSGAVFDLYAKWAASPSAVELPTPTKENGVFTGWYNADEDSIGNAGDSYTPSGNETLKAHWKPGASSENNNDDVSDGKIVINGPHATFTIAGPTDIYYYTDGSCGDDGYFLASIDKEQSKTYTLSWSCDPSCTIEVTKISFWAKAYNWAAGRASKAKVIFNEKTTSVGTAALTCNSADYATLTGSGSFSSPMTIECQNTFNVGGDVIPPYDFDFYLKNIVFEYKITPNAPTPHNANLTATLSESDKQTLDVRIGTGSLFTMTDPADDFEYSYRLKEDYANAHIEDGYFWATAAGDYEIQACVTSADDHEASAWSTCTVHVTRTCVFNNTTGDKEWGTTDNWAYNITPNSTDAVRVLGNLTIDEQIEMQSLSIEGAAVVEIAPTGGLTVGAGGITGADAEHLILKAGTAGDEKCQTGYLRISPEYGGDMPEAKVEMYTIAYHNKNAATGSKSFYQCMGAPISDAGVMAKTVFGAGSYLYTWNESTEDWTNSRTSLEFTPFKGFEVTQKKNSAGLLYTHAGHIVSGSDVKTIDLEYTSAEKGYNLLANSWTAPIDISQFETEDFVDATSTIYILNAGTKNNSDNPGESVDAPGKWIGVPIKTAAELAADGLPRVISSMQGFWVKANSGSAQLKLDYSRLVWGVNYSGYTANKPLRVQQRDMEEEDESRVEKMKINIYGAEESDVLYMLESNKYDKAYEDGYDAYKVSSEGLDLYSIEEDAKLSVDATYSISGTALGLRTGDETAYTFRFTRVTADKWALWDIETGQKIDINEGTEYTFFTEPDSEINGRFMIIEREEGNNTTTQIENTNKNTKGSKFIKNDCLYILKDGKLYDTLGRRVR